MTDVAGDAPAFNGSMRMLIVTQYFWPESFRISEFVRSLRALGCSVTILSSQPNYPEGAIFDGYSALSLCAQLHEGLRLSDAIDARLAVQRRRVIAATDVGRPLVTSSPAGV